MLAVKRPAIWPDPRVKPPFGAARVNWGHPLAEGLRACFLLNERAGIAYNLVGAPHASIFASAGRNPWTDQGWLGDGTTLLGSRVPVVPVTAYAITMACEASATPGGTFPTYVQLDDPASATAYVSIYFSNGASEYVYEITGAVSVTSPAVAGRLDRLTGLSRSATQHEFWRNGMLQSQSSTAATFPTVTGLSLGLAHNAAPAGKFPMNGRLNWVALWRRDLTPTQIAELAEMPFAYLEPIPSRARRFDYREALTYFVASR
jgi:hypothetical protein